MLFNSGIKAIAIAISFCSFQFEALSSEIGWTTEIISEPQSIATWHDKIIMASRGQIVCIESNNGDILWKTRDLCSWLSLANDNEIVIASTLCGAMYWINPANGNIEKELDIGAQISESLIYGDKIFSKCNDGYLYCINKNSQEIMWKTKVGKSYAKNMIVDKDIIMLCTYDDKKYFHSFVISIQTGDVIWKNNINYRARPVVSNEIILVEDASNKKCILVVARKDGSVIKRLKTTDKIINMVINRSKIFCITESSILEITDNLSLEEKYKIRNQAKGSKSLEYISDKIFIVGFDEKIVLYDLSNNRHKEIRVPFEYAKDQNYEAKYMLVGETLITYYKNKIAKIASVRDDGK
jgi:hypothetical protein